MEIVVDPAAGLTASPDGFAVGVPRVPFPVRMVYALPMPGNCLDLASLIVPPTGVAPDEALGVPSGVHVPRMVWASRW